MSLNNNNKGINNTNTPSSSSTLESMLGQQPSKSIVKKGGSATVAGTPSSHRASEIIVRADGKKVRRVLKSQPGSSVGGGSVVGSSTATDESEIYIRADGKRVRRVLRKPAAASATSNNDLQQPVNNTNNNSSTTSVGTSTTATSSLFSNHSAGGAGSGAGLGGFLTPTTASTTRKPTSAATVTGAEGSYNQGEIVVRADGKKVRRIKRTPTTSAITPLLSPSALDATPPSPSKLAGFLQTSNNNSTISSPKRGSATVVGLTGGTSSSSLEEGTIYINAQGKKVRRVKRVVRSSSSSSLTPPTDTAAGAALTPPLLGGFLGTQQQNSSSKPAGPRGSAVSVGGAAASAELGEIFVNAQGKRVRRVKRPMGSGGSASVAGDFADSSNKNKDSTNNTAAVAAADGRIPGSASKAKTIAEGEIFTRDGKKYRRVKRSNSSVSLANVALSMGAVPDSLTPTTTPPDLESQKKSNLDGFLGRSNSTPTSKAAITGSATVAGDRVSSKIDGSTVYINAQGKKVRRVKKVREPESGTQLGLAQSILQERQERTAAIAAAAAAKGGSSAGNLSALELPRNLTLPMDMTATKSSLSRLPLPTPDVSLLQPKPEVASPEPLSIDPIIQDEYSSKGVNENITGEKFGLDSLLQGGIGGKSKPGASGSATVSGDNGKPLSSDVYIRADGKRVRRVRRTTNGTVTPPASLGGFLKEEGGNAKKQSGAATVVGDRKLDGYIVIRPDGKRVIRRAKSKQGAGDSVDGETMVYRNAEGKLVRRVKRTTSSSSSAIKTSTSTGSDDVGQQSNSLNDRKVDTAKVHVQDKFSKRASMSRTTDISKSSIPLSDEEEAIASGFRKMRRMGLPDDAVRHKMTVSDVSRKIIAAVMGDEWKEDTAEPLPQVESTVTEQSSGTTTSEANSTSLLSAQLNHEEEEIAALYRKMRSMGLPDDAIRQKMSMGDVSPAIVAAVMKDDNNDPSLSPEAKLPLKNAPDSLSDPSDPESRNELESISQRDAIDDSNSMERHTLTAPSVELSDEEELIAAPFRKMQRMGLRNDAIRHKMISSDTPAKIMAALMGDPWIDEQSAQEQITKDEIVMEEASVAASPQDESSAVVETYKKMLKMGLPDDAVRHKMILAGVDPEILALVFNAEPSESPTSSALCGDFSAEEEETVAQYRKMRQMGLPDDAVRHKMIVNEVDPKIISAVFHSPMITNEQSVSDIKPYVPAASYVVVVGDAPVGLSPTSHGEVSYGNSAISLNPDEKFAVKVADDNSNSPTKETKFFTLEELANMSGQSKSELEAIVAEKRQRGASPPRFSLQPLDVKKYEVMLPNRSGHDSPAPVQGNPPVDPRIVTVVKEGQEVVDSQLATAARAVSALGDGDMSALFEKLQAGDMKDLLEKLHEAEKRQKKLEKQLAQAGVAIAEDIEYQEAKGKVEQIAKRMNEIGGSDVTVADKDEQNRLREEYFKLEQEMERYNTALMLSEEYQAEQDRLERKWEKDNEPGNIEALKKIRRHMPVNIRHLSEADLTTKPSPNGKYLPAATAKKFKRTNILQCLRLNPDDLECMHPATLENMRVTGLTLTERRALYIHFKPVGPKWERNKAEKMTERKWTWYQMMKNNFKENVAPYQRHVDQYGGPIDHVCPLLGKQCPIRADKIPDYDGDYGWTDNAEYEISDVRKADVEDSGAKAMAEAMELAKEKKANERADLLKKHYKGKLLQVSKANGGCEAMDESMDQLENYSIKWIEFMLDKGESISEDDKKKEVSNFTEALNEFKLKLLNFAQRSGMQISGKKMTGGDSPDIRSSVEASLAEEVYETSKEFFSFISTRMKQLVILDTRAKKMIEMLEGICNELHLRNLALFEALGMKRMTRSRKLRSNMDLKKEVEAKRKASEEKESPEVEATPSRPPPPGGRGGLLDSISGRGGGGGRGGLLDAIGGRGRGGGGRGGLLDAIGGRGRGGGGRGGLLDAISAGRGRGGRGGDSGGRGGLLSAIAGRGAGGGRGGLLAAIAAKGNGD